MIGSQTQGRKKGLARKRDGQQDFGRDKTFELSWGIEGSYRHDLDTATWKEKDVR